MVIDRDGERQRWRKTKAMRVVKDKGDETKVVKDIGGE